MAVKINEECKVSKKGIPVYGNKIQISVPPIQNHARPTIRSLPTSTYVLTARRYTA